MSPTTITIEVAEEKSDTDCAWPPVTPLLKAAYANTIDTTEAGAYGLCLAAAELQVGLVAIHRAETLAGADWYVAPLGAGIDDLEDACRFEVSGVDKGRRSSCDQRLRAKIKQTIDAQHESPAIAAVAGFEQRLVLLWEVASE